MSKYLSTIFINRLLNENMAAGLGTMATIGQTVIEPFNIRNANDSNNSIETKSTKIKAKNIINKYNDNINKSAKEK